jgi:ABC-type multidrug transport system fused ATPase/permease subunit
VGATASFSKSEIEFRGGFKRSVFETIFMVYRHYLNRLIPLMVIGFLSRLLLLANANIMGFWADSFCPPDSTCRPIPKFFANYQTDDFIRALMILTASGFVLMTIYRIRFSRLSAQAISGLYDETTLRVSRFPMSFFDRQPAGRIITRFSSDYNTVFRMFGGPLAEFLTLIFDIFSMMILLGLASPFYLLTLAVLATLNYIVYRLNRDRLRLKRRDLSRSRAPSISHFAETAQGASSIRAFQREDIFSQRFTQLDQNYLDHKRKTFNHIIGFGLQMNINSAIILFVTGLLGYFLVQKGHVSLGSIGVAISFITLTSYSLQMFFDWLAQFEEALIGVERLDNYLRGHLEPGAALPRSATFPTAQVRQNAKYETELAKPSPLEKTKAEVAFNSVSLRYGTDLPLVLKNISFKIHAGERIGIVGRTGSGKSSLIQALFYLYPIEQGRISIDGWAPDLQRSSQQEKPIQIETKTLNIEQYRQAIAYITQVPVLFSGTLRNNLDPYAQRNDTALTHVLSQVGLDSWLNSCSEKLDYVIEENGRNLSMGERQLICMARCLLQKSPVVIMDEATSSVDPQTEEILSRATDDFFADRTQIIIAHRLSTLKRCDRILWIQRGEIKMYDTREKVLPLFQATDLGLESTP